MSESQIIFRPHSIKQDNIIFSDAPLTIVLSGTQFGKSQAGAMWLKRQVHTFTDKTDNFLLMAPNYKIMQQSALPYVLYALEGLGKYLKADAAFQLHTGGHVFLRTGTDPDSVVGIPKVRAYWLDEAGKASLYFYENIQARAAAVGARGLLTTSPYSLNWLYKNYIKPKKEGQLPEVALIQAASWENPFHGLADPERRAQMQASMDPRRFAMVFGGEMGRMQGLVYDCWDDDENLVDAFPLPTGTRYVAGVDWGTTNPFALLVRAITPDGRHYQVSEYYKTGHTLLDMIDVAKQKQALFGIQMFYCDPSQPGYIEEFNRAGLTAMPADNDINRGIDLHYEMIKTRRYKIFRGSSPHTMDEMEGYHWPEPEDLGPDDDQKERKPVAQNNHAVDAARYTSIMTYRSHEKKAPSIPSERRQETQAQRIERLKRRPRGNSFESWS